MSYHNNNDILLILRYYCITLVLFIIEIKKFLSYLNIHIFLVYEINKGLQLLFFRDILEEMDTKIKLKAIYSLKRINDLIVLI